MRLASEESAHVHVQLFGTLGQSQGGIDIYARDASGSYSVYQCKRTGLSARDVGAAVDRFLSGEWASAASRFVLCTSSAVTRTELAHEVERQAARLRELDQPVAMDVWDAHRLSVALKSRRELVLDFFGRAWLDRFDPEPQRRPPQPPGPPSAEESDRGGVFISYATEDKEEIARPLADELIQRGVAVWFDQYELRLGEPLSETLDRGLRHARAGVVILSPEFFEKRWTRWELRALTQREMAGEDGVILPVWHNVDVSDVQKFSLELADRVAAKSSEGTEAIADAIEAALEKLRAGEEPMAVLEDVAGEPPFARRRQSVRRIASLAATGAVLASLAALGWWLGSKPESRREEGRALRLEVPRDWKREASPHIPGVRLHQPVALTVPSPNGAGVVAGTTDASGPTLLPRGLISRVKLARSEARAFMQNGLAGYHYSHLQPRGGTLALDVTVVPATGGVRMVVCYARPADAVKFAQECERVARSIELRNDRALPLEPIEAYAMTLSTVVAHLDSASRRWGGELRAARGPRRRAAVAAKLEAAYQRGETALAAASVSPLDRHVADRLLAAIRSARQAYAEMAAADSPTAINASNAAARAAVSAEHELRMARAGLAELGYRMG